MPHFQTPPKRIKMYLHLPTPTNIDNPLYMSSCANKSSYPKGGSFIIKYASYLLLLCLACLSVGCASITGSKNQPITVTAVCENIMVRTASCTVTNEKGVSYTSTPGTVMVQKSTSDLTIACSKSDFSANPVTVKSSSNASIWGNILLGGPIGAAVDAGTGAGFDYPPTVNVVFNPPCEDIADSPKPKSSKSLAAKPVASNESGDRIRELNKLFEDGDISKKEYDIKKKMLLDGL